MPAGIYLRKYQTAEQYLSARTKKGKNGCIVWIGSTTRGGYGTCNWKDGKGMFFHTTAHRMAYVVKHGIIPNEMEIDHLCKNTLCVNPDHLEAVTGKINNERGIRANQTHCIYGHLFDERNTYYKSNGCRSCRKCNAERARNHRKQKLTKGD